MELRERVDSRVGLIGELGDLYVQIAASFASLTQGTVDPAVQQSLTTLHECARIGGDFMAASDRIHEALNNAAAVY